MRHMSRTSFLCMLGLLLYSLHLMAGEGDFRLLGSGQGLKGGNVLQMAQLKDGRIAVVTESHVCFYDGKKFLCVPRDKNLTFPLSAYTGFTHIYEDGNRRFWLKDRRSIACLDVQTLQWEKCPDVDDFFVDSRGSLWRVEGDSVFSGKGVGLQRRDTAMVQDIDVSGNSVYVFTDDGKVSLYDVDSGRLLNSYAAYGNEEVEKYKNTSLVVSSNDGSFYQIRTGRKSVLLSFDRGKCLWQRLLDVEYPLHTLIVVSDSNSQKSNLYVSCKRGYWVINLKTGEQHLLTVLRLPDGSTLSTGYNTICHDREGGVWLGSYDKGLLYASPEANIFDSKSRGEVVWLGLGLIAVVFGVVFWWRKQRGKRGIVAESAPKKAVSQKRVEEKTLSAADQAFLDKAKGKVVANLRNANYGVAQLACDLCMERTGLYKKMTAITGLSPVAFIRTIRLERAAQLIKEGGHSIADISELTGFSSSGYFSKCFQKYYGCLPSDFLA